MMPDHPPVGPVPDDALDGLHARYDGCPPRGWRRIVMAGGETALARVDGAAQLARLRAQCAGARLAIARRRRQLPAGALSGDAWLFRLTASLMAARMEAAAAGA